MTAMCHEQGLRRANLRAHVQRCLKGNIHSPKLHFLLITSAILLLQFMAVGATICMSTVITNLHQQLTVINGVIVDKTAVQRLVKEAPT
jgi:hypothetical protein